MAAKFLAPQIQDNPSGWGPCDVPDQFKDMPYQPFSKGDRLGKVRRAATVAASATGLCIHRGVTFRVCPCQCYDGVQGGWGTWVSVLGWGKGNGTKS